MANTVRGMLDTALEMLAGRLSNVFISSPAVSAVSLDLRNSESAEEVRTLTVPLVGLLPTVSRQAQAIVKQVPNAYAEVQASCCLLLHVCRTKNTPTKQNHRRSTTFRCWTPLRL
jgi:hypothetical protein